MFILNNKQTMIIADGIGNNVEDIQLLMNRADKIKAARKRISELEKLINFWEKKLP